MPGIQELLIILVIVLVLFGANKLPGLARSIGQSVNSFKKGLGEKDLEEPAQSPEQLSGSQNAQTTSETQKETEKA